MNHHLDQEVVAGFISEAKGYLPEIMLGLEAFAASPEQAGSIKEAFRYAHIIKGAASMLGFREISEVAYQLEVQLELLCERQMDLTQEMLEELCQNVSDLSELLDTSLATPVSFSHREEPPISAPPAAVLPASTPNTTDFDFSFTSLLPNEQAEKEETQLLEPPELGDNVLAQTPPAITTDDQEKARPSVLDDTNFSVSLPETPDSTTVGELNLSKVAADLKERFGDSLPSQPEFPLPTELMTEVPEFQFEPLAPATIGDINLLEVPENPVPDVSYDDFADHLADSLLSDFPASESAGEMPESVRQQLEAAAEEEIIEPEPTFPSPEAEGHLPELSVAEDAGEEIPELLPLPELPELVITAPEPEALATENFAPALEPLEATEPEPDTFTAQTAPDETDSDYGPTQFDSFLPADLLVETRDVPHGALLSQDLPEELLEIFLLEAEEHLQIMHAALRALEKQPDDIASLQEIRRSAHSLKGTAALVGFRNIMQLAHRMEDLLDLVYEEKFVLTPKPTQLLMRATDMLEDMSSGQIDEAALQNIYTEFDLTLTEAETIPASIPSAQSLLAEEPLVEPEPAIETYGETHLIGPVTDDEPISTSLNEPSNAAEYSLLDDTEEAFLQEPILDGLPVPAFEPIADTPDVLEMEAAPEPELTTPHPPIAAAPEETIAATTEPVSMELPAVASLPPLPAPTTFSSVIEPAAPFAFSQEEPDIAPSSAGVSVQSPSQFLRVPIERLDEVVKLIGEMIITRTSFEQRLADFAHQVEELQIAGSRLRRAAAELESKYEACTLGGDRTMVGRLPVGMSAIGLASTLVTHNTYGFDDLEFDRYTEFHLVSRELVESSSDIQTVGREFAHLNSDFLSYVNRQSRTYNELQDRLIRLRMVPLASISQRMHRAVRQVSNYENKLVELVLEGEATAIDTTALQELIDPLVHLLRNAVDHGIEMPEVRVAKGKLATGRITLRAFYEGSQVILQLSDDGKGLDSEKIRAKATQYGLITTAEAETMSQAELWSLIFTPGFSTAGQVSEISGRGMGMDIVHTTVQKLKGTITIDSRPDAGVTFTLRLPLTLAVTRALMVKAHGQSFAVPLDVVTKIMRLDMSKIERIGKEPIIRIGGKIYPLLMLSRLLNLQQLSDEIGQRPPALLINIEGKEVVVIVDQLMGGREIVIKTLGTHLRKVHGVMGATLMGNGEVVLILNLAELIRGTARSVGRRPVIVSAESPVRERTQAHINEPLVPMEPQTTIPTPKPKAEKRTLTVMIVDDSPSVRRVSANLIKNTGWVPVQAKDGLEALEKLQAGEVMPDLMMLDIEMPRMDGYQLLTSLRAQPDFRHLPVVIVSSRSSEKHRQKAFDLGATDYLVKPYQEDHVIGLIQRLVKNENQIESRKESPQ